jgi:hypothetical protein
MNNCIAGPVGPTLSMHAWVGSHSCLIREPKIPSSVAREKKGVFVYYPPFPSSLGKCMPSRRIYIYIYYITYIHPRLGDEKHDLNDFDKLLSQ